MPPHNAETGPTASAKAGVAGVPTMVGRPSGYELRVENDSCLANFRDSQIGSTLKFTRTRLASSHSDRLDKVIPRALAGREENTNEYSAFQR